MVQTARDEWLAAQKRRDPEFQPPMTEIVLAGDLRDWQRRGKRIDRADAQEIDREALTRRLAEIKEMRRQERERNRQRGRDLGRTR